ncbi:MAG: glycine zipper domain-containing protein [Thiotrichaceae bacterium]|nr:glycine zipper domain-containing protein [Thiotrichaceae bacterium]
MMFYRYKLFFLPLLITAILSGCIPTKNTEQNLVRPTSVHSDVDIVQVNRDLRDVNDELDKFWRNAERYMEQDCTSKRNSKGLSYKTKSKQLCAKLEGLNARKAKLIAQRDGYEQYQGNLEAFNHQRNKVSKQAVFDKDQTKTRATGAAAGALTGGIIGNIIGNDSIGTGIGVLVGGVIGALFGDVIAGKKEQQFLTEQQIDDARFKTQKLVTELKEANTYLLNDIHYYEKKVVELEEKKRKGKLRLSELKDYSRSLKQAQDDTQVALKKVSQELKLQKAAYQSQVKQSNQSLNLVNWQAEVNGLEKEKRILSENVNSLLAINASI